MEESAPRGQETRSSILLLVEARFYGEALEVALGTRRMSVTSQWGDLLDPGRGTTASPAVILLDVATEDRPRTVRALLRTFPAARIVALSVRETAPEVVPVVEAGARACIPRGATLADVIAAVDAAVAGRRWYTSKTTGILLRHSAGGRADAASLPLTPRERQILSLIEQGLSNKAIAKRLSIHLQTVKNHVHHILRKMSAESRADAVAKVRGTARESPKN